LINGIFTKKQGMVLSRFWLVIFVSSIAFVIVSLCIGNSYTIDNVLNGKKDDPILISEKYIEQVPKFVMDSIKNAPEQTMIIKQRLLKFIPEFKNRMDCYRHAKTVYSI